MAKQGINTGTAPNDGTGDTLLAGTLKINSNFDDLYNIFGDGTNLISFVSYASTAGYSTNAGIASTSTYAQTARYVTDDIDINTSGILTSSYADIGKITIQQPGAITDGPIEVGFAATMFRIRSDGMVGIGTSIQRLNLKLYLSPILDQHCGRLQNQMVLPLELQTKILLQIRLLLLQKIPI